MPYLTLGKNQTIYIHVTPYFMSTLMSETRTKDELFSAVQTCVTDAATRLIEATRGITAAAEN